MFRQRNQHVQRLRLEGTWPVPGTASRPREQEPKREERGVQDVATQVASWGRRLSFILGAVGIY